MNLKLELERDFLRLQRVLRELRILRNNNIARKDNRAVLEEATRLLEPMFEEYKAKLETMTKPVGDYDI